VCEEEEQRVRMTRSLTYTAAFAFTSWHSAARRTPDVTYSPHAVAFEFMTSPDATSVLAPAVEVRRVTTIEARGTASPIAARTSQRSAAARFVVSAVTGRKTPSVTTRVTMAVSGWASLVFETRNEMTLRADGQVGVLSAVRNVERTVVSAERATHVTRSTRKNPHAARAIVRRCLRGVLSAPDGASASCGPSASCGVRI
jgi:hypothetical protein